ncbi:hypothetical protein, partial [Crocosphaera sp.]|uniref:hypothetical protein n=1 Tax=Crocosphaera sp. TaxID=2729996 RepID=UPI002604F62A
MANITGDKTNNLITGTQENDYLSGRDGNDSLYGRDGDDALSGGNGNDYLSSGNGNDYLSGGDGNDYLSGGDGNDYLSGGNENDSLSGGDGNDSLDGGHGNDYLSGGNGNDYLSGRDGDDYLSGGNGNNTLYGGDGDDSLYSRDGDDTLSGGDGDDYLSSGHGNDVLDGGNGNNTLYGGDGDDSLSTGFGDDILDGGFGNDTLNGGDGNDIFTGVESNSHSLGEGEIDIATGGRGQDIFILENNSGVFYNDNDSVSEGINDYLLITDFTVGQDSFQVQRDVSHYRFCSSPFSIFDLGLYLVQEGETDELIAIIDGVYDDGLSEDFSIFSYYESFNTTVDNIESIVEQYHGPTAITLSNNTIEENSARNTVVGDLITIDPDLFDIHTYTLIDDAGGRFAINEFNQIIISNNYIFDFEIENNYEIEVLSIDNEGFSITQRLTIDLEDVVEEYNEPVLITLPIQSALSQFQYLNKIVDKNQAILEVKEERLTLINQHNETERNRLNYLLVEEQNSGNQLESLIAQKNALDNQYQNEVTVTEERINLIIDNLAIAKNNLEQETNTGLKEGILKEINSYYWQLQQEQNLLGLKQSDYYHNVELLSFQITEVETQLSQLKNNEIPQQEVVLESINPQLTVAQQEWEIAQENYQTAKNSFDRYLEKNPFLLAKDKKFFAQTIPELDSQIQKNNSDLNDFELHLSELELDLNQLIIQLEELENQNNLTSIENKQAEINNKRAEIENQKNKINRKQEELEQQENNLSELQFYRNNYSEYSDYLSLFVNNIEKKIITLETELQALQQEGVNSEAISFKQEEIAQQQQYLTELQTYRETIVLEETEFSQKQQTILDTETDGQQAINQAIEINTIESYVSLITQLGQQTQGLIDIWVDHLEESHNYTLEIYNSSQAHSEVFDNLSGYLIENLDSPFEEYSLNSIQLEEANLIYDGVLQRRDGLMNAVDDLEDAIALLQKKIEQGEEISEELSRINDLITLENQYYQSYSENPENVAILSPQLLTQLSQEINHQIEDLTVKIDLEGLENQETYLETTLANYLENQQQNILQSTVNQDEKINNFQSLRLKTAYSITLANTNPDLLQEYLETSFPNLNNLETLGSLQEQIEIEQEEYTQELNELQASIQQKEAEAAAALSQAEWYQEQAEFHYQRSRKQGPTWNEYRKSKGRSGSSKTITVTHVDHDWIIYDNYTKQANSFREYAKNLLNDVDQETDLKDIVSETLAQWNEASDVADQAEYTYNEFVEMLETLEAQRDSEAEQLQIEAFQQLLPTLQQDLVQAETEVINAKQTLETERTEYQTSQQVYQATLETVLDYELLDPDTQENLLLQQSQTQQLLQQITNVEAWIIQETSVINSQLPEVQQQKQPLLDKIADIESQLTNNPNNDHLLSQKAQIETSLNLLTQKESILTAQQANLTQKQTLLDAQRAVINAEAELFATTLINPDTDTSQLETFLLDTQAALTEAQRLAELAEDSSNALTENLEALEAHLLLQNDQYLAAINNQHQLLQDLIEQTELREDYTLEALEKQLELNTLETQLIVRLEELNQAGSQEAQSLLEVARNQNIETAAEIYWRDYSDLLTDTGGGCAGGIARPDDKEKADRYYQEMLKYRALKEDAQQQVDYYNNLKNDLQTQVNLIQEQLGQAEGEFTSVQEQLANATENIDDLNQQLEIAEIRIDVIKAFRDWTEQINLQVLQIEQLNLAQAQLAQTIAQNRQENIDLYQEQQLQRQQADINRQRAIATAKIEQLSQLETEDALQDAINDLRSELELDPIADIINLAEYKGQLAGFLSDLEALEQQNPDLPQDVKTLLAETQGDIHQVLQGNESQTIQENLLNTANSLVTQAQQLQSQITQLEVEETQLVADLQQVNDDLQTASRQLWDEVQANGVLDAEQAILTQENLQILYEIGFAQGAIDLSSELAQQSKDILNQIIEGRIEERKARKKAAFNQIFGTVTMVIAAVAAVYTAGTALSAFAGAISNGATFSAAASAAASAATTAATSTFVTTLNTINASLSAVQSAYNGDLEGAIFNAGMATLGFAGLKESQQILSGLYNGYQAIDNGDGLTGFLNLVSGALPVLELSKYTYLAQAALSIESGVKLVEEGELLAATSNFLSSAFSLGSRLNGTDGSLKIDLGVSEELLNILSTVELAVNVVDGVKTIVEDGNLEGWLQGIQGLAGGVNNYFQQQKEIEENKSDSGGGDDTLSGGSGDDTLSGGSGDDTLSGGSDNGSIFGLNSSNTPINSIDEEIITKIAQSKAENPEDIQELKQALSQIIERVKNYDYDEMSSSDFTKEELQGRFFDEFIFNPDVTDSQIIETSKLKIEDFKTKEDQEEHSEFATNYQNYEDFSAHQDSRAIFHFLTGIPTAEISKNLAGLGFTGTKDIHWKSNSDKWRQGTAFHDVTSTLDWKFNQQQKNVNSWNKSVYGIESIVLSAIVGVGIRESFRELFDSDLDEINSLVDILFKLAIKPINWITEQIDPLIIDLDDNGINLINLDNSLIRFDLDADGYAENTAWVSPEDGILALDLNQDGTINDITEIFSEYFNDGSPNSGLDALATLDSNQNGIISATDTQFNQILVWQDINQDGISQPDELKTLTEHGITSINLNGVNTEIIQDGNIIKQRSIFNRNDGTSGEISDIAFLVTQTGFKVNQTDTGIEILAEDDTAVSLFIHENETDLTLNLADTNLQVAIGNIGNDYLYTTANNDIFLSGEAGDDTLLGSDGNDWLVGDEGSDRLEGFAGDDLIYIDAQDNFIDGGDGTDIAIVTTIDAVTLDLGNANLEMVMGNDGDDIFTHSGNYTVVMEGGNGNDNLTGGSNDDVLNGGDGNDIITGGLGGDILTGG